VKRYVNERGSTEVATAIHTATLVGTSMISRVETVAALAKAIRVKVLAHEAAEAARAAFHQDWPDLVRVQATEGVIIRADEVAWAGSLRGYDAVQLASALVWRENIGYDVTFATFDRRLWEAAQQHALGLFPLDLPRLLASWQAEAE
jgi:predicted nucleic acid-binding protein